jgi:clan AA aspartic protease (TIGR02281 family)
LERRARQYVRRLLLAAAAAAATGIAGAADHGAIADATQPDIATARRLAVAAQQQARAEQQKAQAASRRAEQERNPGAGYGSIVYPAGGGYYWGEKNAAGQRDGDGILYYRVGRCECRFSHDAAVGAGVVMAAGGDRYEGELTGNAAGSANGYGVYTWADGRRYEGQFTADKPNGAGVLLDALGTPQPGVWRNGTLLDARPPSLADAIEHAAPGSSAPASGAVGVPLGTMGGTYTIPVVINGSLRIPFIVDSGASEVTIPEDVVRVLLRGGTVDKSDLLGAQRYVTADGSHHIGLRLRLRQLQVGDRVVRDVTAGISPMRGDPLLGQTFLSRFGAWTIDNQTHRLILAPQ